MLRIFVFCLFSFVLTKRLHQPVPEQSEMFRWSREFLDDYKVRNPISDHIRVAFSIILLQLNAASLKIPEGENDYSNGYPFNPELLRRDI